MWGLFRLFSRKSKTEHEEEAKKPEEAHAEEEDVEYGPPPLRITDLPEESDAYLRDTKWPPDPRFNKTYTVRQVFNQQGGLIRKICSAMPLSDEDLEKYFLPAVWNVANFVHLLSASRDNHHRGYGGLFAHSLETSLYAVNISKNKIFDFSEAPEVAFHNRGRWILACALAGLVHDVGKAVTDITVRTKQGEVWNPNDAPLGTWLELHGRPEFTFSWNSGREYTDHPLASLDYARKLVPEETYRYLTSASNRNIERELRAAILGGEEAKNNSLIAQIIRQADSLSVRLDNEASGDVDKRDKLVTSEPADKVMQTIRELIADGKWTVNGEDSRVFVTNRGTFILWADVRDILSRLRAQGYAGAPENRDVMASLLLDRGLFERPPETVDTMRRLYWPVCPLVKRDEYLSCVKAAVPERLFIGPMPAEMPAIVRRLPAAEDEVLAWKERWGFFPLEEEAKEDVDAYMAGLLSEADAYEESCDDEEEVCYEDLLPDDLDYNGVWGAEADYAYAGPDDGDGGAAPQDYVDGAPSGPVVREAKVRAVGVRSKRGSGEREPVRMGMELPGADEMISGDEMAEMLGMTEDEDSEDYVDGVSPDCGEKTPSSPSEPRFADNRASADGEGAGACDANVVRTTKSESAGSDSLETGSDDPRDGLNHHRRVHRALQEEFPEHRVHQVRQVHQDELQERKIDSSPDDTAFDANGASSAFGANTASATDYGENAEDSVGAAAGPFNAVSPNNTNNTALDSDDFVKSVNAVNEDSDSTGATGAAAVERPTLPNAAPAESGSKRIEPRYDPPKEKATGTESPEYPAEPRDSGNSARSAGSSRNSVEELKIPVAFDANAAQEGKTPLPANTAPQDGTDADFDNVNSVDEVNFPDFADFGDDAEDNLPAADVKDDRNPEPPPSCQAEFAGRAEGTSADFDDGLGAGAGAVAPGSPDNKSVPGQSAVSCEHGSASDNAEARLEHGINGVGVDGTGVTEFGAEGPQKQSHLSESPVRCESDAANVRKEKAAQELRPAPDKVPDSRPYPADPSDSEETEIPDFVGFADSDAPGGAFFGPEGAFADKSWNSLNPGVDADDAENDYVRRGLGLTAVTRRSVDAVNADHAVSPFASNRTSEAAFAPNGSRNGNGRPKRGTTVSQTSRTSRISPNSRISPETLPDSSDSRDSVPGTVSLKAADRTRAACEHGVGNDGSCDAAVAEGPVGVNAVDDVISEGPEDKHGHMRRSKKQVASRRTPGGTPGTADPVRTGIEDPVSSESDAKPRSDRIGRNARNAAIATKGPGARHRQDHSGDSRDCGDDVGNASADGRGEDCQGLSEEERRALLGDWSVGLHSRSQRTKLRKENEVGAGEPGAPGAETRSPGPSTNVRASAEPDSLRTAQKAPPAASNPSPRTSRNSGAANETASADGKAKTSSPVRHEESGTEERGARSRRRRRKNDRNSPKREVRRMIEELKRQMIEGDGPYVSLGVVRRANGVLETHSLPFEKALDDAGLDRPLVTGELTGFQPPPVLSVDWSKSLFTLSGADKKA